MSGAPHAADHGHEAHRPVSFYLAIAVFLALLTAFELGPLFDLYRIPPALLIGLSAIKFGTVVAFFMHLWDDSPVFTRLFVVPLGGATLMILVLMTLFGTFATASAARHDPFAVQERYWSAYNGHCAAWLRSFETNRWYCSSSVEMGAIDSKRVLSQLIARNGPIVNNGPAAPDLAAMSEADAHAWLLKRGEEVYSANCVACHQASGEGVTGVFPPLKGSVSYYGEPKNHAKIIVKGLSGKIQVQGVDYNGAMPAHAQFTDADIAAVASYERNSWGNADGFVMPGDVASVR